MIIRGGENIYPIDIEAVIAECPGVAAFLTAAPSAQIDIEKIRAYCRDRLARYKMPEIFEIIDEMPLNASGKILKRELRARLSGSDSA
jgi:acyl-CoA synthetase (AMP-forming)/AMP-acid ligase II